MFPNPNQANNGGILAGGGGALPKDSAATAMGHTQQNMNYNGMQAQSPHQQQPIPQQQPHSVGTKSKSKRPYVRVIEQPASKALRFRYECEGRSAGSIPGVNSTAENKTYPAIEIVGYKGRAVVVVSCVTREYPHRPHPHNLVGKENCKKGVCTMEVNSETMRAVFSNLGIQCVKKKDIDPALKAREEIRVDPYKTGFSHRYQPSSIDLNSLRLCFQVFMESEKGRFTLPIAPVVSDPIYDKKAMSDLVICRLCSCSTTVLGNTTIILLCEKVTKEDIAIRFFEEKNDQIIWEAYGDFQHTDVHKQTAITFKTPRYRSIDITEPAKVFIQLKRPSDGITSEPLPFEYIPLDSGRHAFCNLRRNLKRKPDDDIFQQILAVASGSSSNSSGDGGSSKKEVVTEVIDLNTPMAEQADKQIFSVVAVSQLEADEAAKRRSEHEVDTIIDEKVRELEQQHQQQEMEQQQVEQQEELGQQQQLVQSQQEAPLPMEQEPQLPHEPRQLSTNDKITEWMKSNELEQMDNTPTPTNEVNAELSMAAVTTASDEDKTLNDLLEQVAELDEIYSDHMMQRESYNAMLSDLSNLESTATARPSGKLKSMEVEDSFDDAATYTSLQRAFKNPIDIPIEDLMPPTPPASHIAPEDTLHYDHVEVMSDPAAALNSPTYAPPRPAPPKFSSPHMHITAAEEEKLPPLPPKRLRKQDSNAENRASEANLADASELKPCTKTPIIIMKTPDQSPPTKRLPPKPGNSASCSTLPRQKKPGFFSKLFSRRKSKPDLCQGDELAAGAYSGSKHGSKATSPNESREPSIGHFNMYDSNRCSMRSAKSMQPLSLPTSPAKDAIAKSQPKTGRPVGRSVSSVSGKRPAHLNANVIHIPLKGESANSLPQNEAYSNASTMTLNNTLDRRTVSALQLAEIPLSEGNMELVAIADRQSLRNLCEGAFNVQLDPNVDLTEAEHFALYTSIPPQATASEFDDASAYYAQVDAGEILTPEQIAARLAAANRVE